MWSSKWRWKRYNLYWMWRLSIPGRIWSYIQSIFFIHWHARAIAIHLDDCLRAMGQMNHPANTKEEDGKYKGMMLMPISTRSELIQRSWKTLPHRKFRKD